MQCTFHILLLVAISLCAGCDLHMLNPRWHELANHGASYVPGDHTSAHFVHGCTDDEFAEAVRKLRKMNIKQLNLQNTTLSDKSIDRLLQLRRLEALYVNGTNFTVEGLARLNALSRLKRLYVAIGQFNEQETKRLRAALPALDVELTPTGAYRYEKSAAG